MENVLIGINEHYYRPKKRHELKEAGAYIKIGKFTVQEAQIVEDKIGEYLEENGLSREEFLNYLRDKDRYGELGVRMRGIFLYVARALPGRYVHSVNAYITAKYHAYNRCGSWTPEEDEMLLKLHELNGSNWAVIQKEMRRSGRNCKDRLRCIRANQLDNIQRSTWSIDELEKLCSIVYEYQDTHGTNAQINWKLIETKMETRSEFQCREKWNSGLCNKERSMEPCVWIYFNSTPFSHEEDEAICNALKECDLFHEQDIVWSSIAVNLKNRNISNVRRRWEQLKKTVPNPMSYLTFDDLLNAVIAKIK